MTNKRFKKGEQPRQAWCPYCYEGWIVKEKETNTYYCAICKRQVKIKEIPYYHKDQVIRRGR